MTEVIELNLSTIAVIAAVAVAAIMGFVSYINQEQQSEITGEFYDTQKEGHMTAQMAHNPSQLEAQNGSDATSPPSGVFPTIAYDLSRSPGKQTTFPSVRKPSVATDLLKDIDSSYAFRSPKPRNAETYGDTYEPPSSTRKKSSIDILSTPVQGRKNSRFDLMTTKLESNNSNPDLSLAGKRKKSVEMLSAQSSGEEVTVSTKPNKGGSLKLEMLNTDGSAQNDDDFDTQKPATPSLQALKISKSNNGSADGIDSPQPQSAALKTPTVMMKLKSPAPSTSSGEDNEVNTPSKALRLLGEDPNKGKLDRSIISPPSNFSHLEHFPATFNGKLETHLNPTNEDHRLDSPGQEKKKPVIPLGDYGFNANSFALALEVAPVKEAAAAIRKLKVMQAANTLQCMSPQKVIAIMEDIPLSEFKSSLEKELSNPTVQEALTSTVLNTSIPSTATSGSVRKDGFNASSLAKVLETVPVSTAVSALQNATPPQAAETLKQLSEEKRNKLVQQLPPSAFKTELSLLLGSQR